MLEFLLDLIANRQLLLMMFAAVAAAATVLTLAMPLLSADQLEKRMAAVASERERIRQRERDRMARGEKASLRTSPRQYMQTVVEKFKLSDYVGQEAVRAKLIEACRRWIRLLMNRFGSCMPSQVAPMQIRSFKVQAMSS